MIYSGDDPESHITEYTQVYEDKLQASPNWRDQIDRDRGRKSLWPDVLTGGVLWHVQGYPAHKKMPPSQGPP